MAQLALSCPHCRAEKIGFSYRSHCLTQPGRQSTLVFMQCEGCGEGIIVQVHSTPQTVQNWVNGGAATPGKILTIEPEPSKPECPADVPSNVEAAYLSGLDNLGRKGGSTAAAIMFRRTVELAVKRLNPDGKGNLKARISELSSDLATPAMKDWAHHVRLEANDATHEAEEFSEEDAAKLHVFAEMFLTYAFTLPEMLKRAKEQANSPTKITKEKGGPVVTH